ncbi:MAG: DCC1-like thiol-disulfide oxidoreductase family protein [Epsilonproteobacteria bacterium]|nr:DCC1-like thiol-disulfide oxidoreductase family protein [Campylobacterota bacterium]
MKPKATLYYDGECPFCRYYSNFVDLRKEIDITLKNARENLHDLKAFKHCNIHEGMIIVDAFGACYQGVEALHWIDNHLEDKSTSITLHHLFISNRSIASYLYKAIRLLRVLLLKMMGKKVNF